MFSNRTDRLDQISNVKQVSKIGALKEFSDSLATSDKWPTGSQDGKQGTRNWVETTNSVTRAVQK